MKKHEILYVLGIIIFMILTTINVYIYIMSIRHDLSTKAKDNLSEKVEDDPNETEILKREILMRENIKNTLKRKQVVCTYFSIRNYCSYKQQNGGIMYDDQCMESLDRACDYTYDEKFPNIDDLDDEESFNYLYMMS